jgi:hypothetical protein
LQFSVICAAVALVVGLTGALLRGDGFWSVVVSAVEAMVLAVIGGVLARTFISLLLWTGRDAPSVSFVLGWAFFLWPGAFDMFATLFRALRRTIKGTRPRLVLTQYLTRPVVLVWIATSVGAFTGMMDGLWQTHQWAGPGVAAYFLDETWGLAGSTNGDLLHLYNFAWADHVVGETRTDTHRYKKGFGFKPGYTFTQGAVMSGGANAQPNAAPGSSSQLLFAHENTHVWQNRAFGPFFTLSYLAWMALFLIPSLIYGLAVGKAGDVIQGFTYFSNPWEAWGYAVQKVDRTTIPQTAGVWPDLAVILVSVFFFLLVLAAAVLIVYRVWSRARR